MELSNEIRNELIKAQRTEITEYHVYKNIAKTLPDEENRKIVSQIGDDEKRHYEIWKAYTGEAVKPNRFQIWLYTAISRVFGFTFGFKLMELGEEKAQVNYQKIEEEIPEASEVIKDEDKHENILLDMLDEEKLLYAGSVVLGLNDALVELTGALAGLTLAFRNVDTIALSGLVTGIAASLSMAASEYLSTSSEDTEKHPVKAAVYTGIAYVVTVALLILPYLLFKNEFLCLGITLVTSVIIIAVFNFYISVAKDEPFGKNFFKMAGLSLSVAAFSFLIGFVIKQWLGVDV
ncbi:MAG: VIT1/CCC1 transporter family protein [Brevefilum sp.]|nr:VIT1/CCC1 transporter family protein [Brevefilum sp.]MDT8382625.1 VIT1/CCC1 transporter family protein [Brevefilum sp.]MDW7755550.1 VIT1/CCC1 transporter family protein [Brevefilum sp.]